ncbi:glutamic acid-rich protein isoform X3 [Eutrema salsugineum]|uniref:glutamic acid-rich protein isoform X3 n=1 Tax=Eutrema salsugineum TaxID=72664 RepID=UPI000CED6E58|nr:glutamic acid-rich protein isoform X3 [Eutrema salsugineum]
MSRCYPFPPPGYVRDESLIESIKGAKEEVKREKKDRKHKKEKKRKERENEADRSKKHRHKKRRKDEKTTAIASSKKVDDDDGHRGLMNSEVASLEKSCLTVDLELQTSSQNSCDSTLHSNERPDKSQTQSQPPLDESGIRVWLPGKEQKDPEAEVMMMTNEDQKQLPSSLSEAPREKRKDPTKLSKEEKTGPLKDNRRVSTLLVREKPSSSHQETNGPSKLCRKCSPSTASRFLNLIENWAPDRVESKLTDSEDQEWWLVMKFGAKRHHPVSNQTTSNGSGSMVWPTARFLPEVEVHALPFTVPF